MGGVVGKRKGRQSEAEARELQSGPPTVANVSRSDDSAALIETVRTQSANSEETAIQSLPSVGQAGSPEGESISRVRSAGGQPLKVAFGRGRVELGPATSTPAAAPPTSLDRQRSLSESDLSVDDGSIGNSTRRAYQTLIREMSASTENSEPSSEFRELLAHMQGKGGVEQPSALGSLAMTEFSDLSATGFELERMLREMSSHCPESPLASMGAPELLHEASASTTASSLFFPSLPHRGSLGGRSGLSVGGGWAGRLGDRSLAQQLDFLRNLESERRIRAQAATDPR